MAWAFVDYENTGSLKEVDLTAYQRVIVLCGPNDRKFEFGSLPSGEFSRIELIPITTGGKNNLDFHLAFHLGRFHELAEESIEFRIISDDAGFDGLISHLEKAGRKCHRVAVKKPVAKAAMKKKAKKKKKKKSAKKAAINAPKKLVQEPAPGALSNPAEAIRSGLAGIAEEKRPASRKSLVNWVGARLHAVAAANGSTPESILEELLAAGVIGVAEGRVGYKFDTSAKAAAPAPADANEPLRSFEPDDEVPDEWDEWDDDIPF